MKLHLDPICTIKPNSISLGYNIGVVKSKTSVVHIWKSNWLYLMIHESGHIPSSKYNGGPRSYKKWKVFIGRGRVEQSSFERVNYFRQGHFPLGKAQGLTRQSNWLVLIMKFQADLKFYSSERLKLTRLGVKSWWGLPQMIPWCACCFILTGGK